MAPMCFASTITDNPGFGYHLSLIQVGSLRARFLHPLKSTIANFYYRPDAYGWQLFELQDNGAHEFDKSPHTRACQVVSKRIKPTITRLSYFLRWFSTMVRNCLPLIQSDAEEQEQ